MVAAKVRVPVADGLPRDRLEARLADAWRHRLALVLGPAGSGKSTLLARFAANAGVPVGWYRAETWDAEEAALLRHLEAALGAAIPGLSSGWQRVEDAAAALEERPRGRVLLVVDDLHALEGTAAEAALARIVDYAPPWLAILAASRVAPAFNLSRLRVSGELLEIDADDLRFRAWEIERLFRDLYGEPVAPGDLAVLARRTEGWAAGLQLFHLATRGKPADERRRFLTGAGASGRLVREYLASNVVAGLRDELRSFLVETSVLGRLSGDLCDRLRGQTGSERLLEELVRRQIFTVPIDGAEGTYRYHEVLRSYLDRMLVDEVGEAEARARHARAGGLLEAVDAQAEALSAYCRAEDWPSVERLIGGQRERLAGGATDWLEVLPPAMTRHDPWLTLAAARRARAEGRWSDALEAFGRAEQGFGTAATAEVCRRERLALAAWLDPVVVQPSGWSALLRSGLAREPLRVARQAATTGEAETRLVAGLLELAAGQVADARATLGRAADDPEQAADLAIAARLAQGVAALLGGDREGSALVEQAVEAAERAGLTWLSRVGRATAGLAGNRPTGADAGAEEVLVAPDDPWASALATLIGAWIGESTDAEATAGGRTEAGERAWAAFRRLGSGVLEAWARGLVAIGLAESGDPDARDTALAAESTARSTGTSGARLLAYLALAQAESTRSSEYALLADTVRRETGLADPPGPHSLTPDGEPAGTDLPSLHVRTFGRFAVELDGQTLSLEPIKPRARSLLRLLAVHPGSAVHREVLGATLWPEADPQLASRSLQVAISALRGLFVDALGPDAGGLVRRDGEAYVLAISPADVDIGQFDEAIVAGRNARANGGSANGSFRSALALHAGELLPEEGPADWVVERREHYRGLAVEAARAVAEEAILEGDLDGAIAACRTGLELDRYHDPLWRLLIEARDRAGDSGAAGRDRREYAAILADLGVAEPVPVSPS